MLALTHAEKTSSLRLQHEIDTQRRRFAKFVLSAISGAFKVTFVKHFRGSHPKCPSSHDRISNFHFHPSLSSTCRAVGLAKADQLSMKNYFPASRAGLLNVAGFTDSPEL